MHLPPIHGLPPYNRPPFDERRIPRCPQFLITDQEYEHFCWALATTAQTGPEIRLITHHSFRFWRLMLQLKDLVITVYLFTTVSKEGLSILAAIRYASFYVIAMCVLRPGLGSMSVLEENIWSNCIVSDGFSNTWEHDKADLTKRRSMDRIEQS